MEICICLIRPPRCEQGFPFTFSVAGHYVPLCLEFRGHQNIKGDIPLWLLNMIHVPCKFLAGVY